MNDEYRKIDGNLILKNNIIGSKYWTLIKDDNFYDIVKKSNVDERWAGFNTIKKYNDPNIILKPMNGYVLHFYPKPELEILNHGICLTQKTHAEIWVEDRRVGIYVLDKTMQRQFYPSSLKIQENQEYFPASLKFYMPWFIDENITVSIQSVSNIFKVSTESISFKKNNGLAPNDAYWIDFVIHKNNTIVKEENYGIIKKGELMYKIFIKNGYVAEKICDEYDK